MDQQIVSLATVQFSFELVTGVSWSSATSTYLRMQKKTM